MVAGAAPLVNGGTGYPDGPPPGHTGGFGEPTCHACHFQFPLNSGDGGLEIAGLPELLTPGETYPITVRLHRPALGAGGFQLAARFRDGANAGTLTPVDDRTAVVSSAAGITYAQHVATGTTPTSDGVIAWVVDWVAPDTAIGSVVFHVAGNAANGDASQFDDLIYSLERIVADPRGERGGAPDAPVRCRRGMPRCGHRPR